MGIKYLPKFLYHATHEDNLDAMLKYGVGANRSKHKTMGGSDYGSIHVDGVFLARSYDEALSYIFSSDLDSRFDSIEDIVVLEIPLSVLDISKFSLDENNDSDILYLSDPSYDSLTYFYSGVIDASDCTLIDWEDYE